MSQSAVAVPSHSVAIDTPLAAPAVTVPNNPALVRWMFQFLRPVKWLAFVACFYLACGIGAEILAVRQTGRAVDHIKAIHVGGAGASAQLGFWHWIVSDGAEATELRRIILSLIGLVTIFLFLRFAREVQNMRFSMEMVFYIREAVYDKLQRVGFGYHDAVSSGQLINRALTDLQNVRLFVQQAILASLEILLIVGGYLILIFSLSPWLSLLALLPLPIWTGYILWFGTKIQPASRAVMDAGDRNVSIIAENIAGVHVVKAFATEQQEIGKYGSHLQEYFRRTQGAIRLWAAFQPTVRGIANASYLTLFLAAGILMIKGRLNAGAYLVLGSAMGAILARLQLIASINEQYQNAIVSARRLYEVLMAPPSVPEKHDARALPPGPGEVIFENVTFGYNPSKPVLHDVSFNIRGGSVVAIVGPTGAGKTTIVSLIARFYDPQKGRILVDGTDLRDLKLADIRRQVAFVFQETYLFSDTVEANIAYGRPGVRGGAVEAAARLAQAHEFIEAMPKGYQAMLGERGSSLSGGQRQRLAIARAILFNPRVLVLDDATAAVDPETEDLIRRGMDIVMRDRTIFIIAHRISSVKRADLVLVVEDGKITQRGKHEELMREDGHYREIAAVQLYGDEEAGEREVPSHMDRMAKDRAKAAAAAPPHPETIERNVRGEAVP